MYLGKAHYYYLIHNPLIQWGVRQRYKYDAIYERETYQTKKMKLEWKNMTPIECICQSKESWYSKSYKSYGCESKRGTYCKFCYPLTKIEADQKKESGLQIETVFCPLLTHDSRQHHHSCPKVEKCNDTKKKTNNIKCTVNLYIDTSS